MINISPGCLQALQNDAVQHAEITVRLLNGETLTLTDADLILNGFEVENHAVCGEQLEVGSMTAAVLKLILDNEDGRFDNVFFAGAELTVNLLIPLADGTSYTIPYGVYTVDEQPRTWSTVELEAFDNMVRLDILFDPQGLGQYINLRSLVEKGLEKAGLNHDGTIDVFPSNARSLLEVSKIQSENPITWRQVLMWCCQCVGVCGFADGNGYIHFGFYKKYTPDILKTELSENLETENGVVLLTDGAAAGDFPLPPSLRFINNMKLDESDCILTGHQFKTDDALYPDNAVMDYGILTENNLVFYALNERGRSNTANTVNTLLAGFTYRPFACDIISMPQLQLLDSVDYYENGQHHHSIVTNYTFRLNGFMRIEAKAKSKVQKGWASLGTLTPGQQAIIDSVSRKVDKTRDQLSSYENALLLFNEKMLRSMGLYKTMQNDPNGGIITYFHNMEALEDSDTIYMFGASGFAWTTEGWNGGNPVWHYGFTSTGDAILNTIHAYKLSAELIETGYLRSQNGASWINMDNGTFCFRSATPEGMDLDTGEAIYSYEKVLELANKQLNVYGTLRSLQYPSYSVSIGKSEKGNFGALTATYNEPGYGDIFQVYPTYWYNVSDPNTVTDRGSTITAPFVGTGDGNRKGVQFNSNESILWNEKNLGSALLCGSDAFVSVFRDNINLSTNASHGHCWFNYYQPKHGYSPIAYDFGNGAGGHADVLCANIVCANVECSRIDCSGQIVGGNTFVDYIQSNGDGYFSGDGTFNGNVTAKSRIVAGGTNYWTDSVLSVNGIATAHSWDVVSDPDLKTNIVKQDGLKALGKISELKFYSYDLKEEISNSQNAHTDIGLMADEAPTEIQSSDGKGIDLYAYISLTAKAVQELTAKIDTLEQKIVELEVENQALKQ